MGLPVILRPSGADVTEIERQTLLLILTVAVAAPLLVELTPRLGLPVVVLEIAAGVAIGPQGFGLAQAGPGVAFLANLGLAMLFFLAGFELDFAVLRGRPLLLGVLGWLLSLAIALAVAFGLQRVGIVAFPLVTFLAMTTTALGVLLPLLRETGHADTRFGRFAISAAVMGEVGPIVLLSFVLGEAETSDQLLRLLLFVALALGAVAVAARARPPALVEALRRRMHSTSQLPLRISVLLLAALVTVTDGFGLDEVLGAATAGILVSTAAEGPHREMLRRKVEGLGFGFFIPVFFIASGMRFDLDSLLASPTSLARVPLFVGLFLVVRGIPAALYVRELALRERLSLAFLSAVQLPLVVAITELAVGAGRMLPENAAALVGAGMLSVFVYPVLASAIRGRGLRPPTSGP